MAQNEVNLFSAEQGFGKGHCVMDLAARVATGKDWPDGSRNGLGVGSVLMLSAEDDPGSVIKPRMMAGLADMNLVHAVPPAVKFPNGKIEIVSIRDNLDVLATELAEFDRLGKPRCQLVIIDPLSAFLSGTDGDSWTDTRLVTTRLGFFAREHGVTLLIVHHFGKDDRRDAKQRSLGSTSWTAASRIFLAGYRDPNDRHRRIFYRDKSNIAADGLAMAYTIRTGAGPLGQSIATVWEPEPFPFEPKDAQPKDEKEERRDFLRNWLSSLTYPAPVRTVYVQAQQLDENPPRTKTGQISTSRDYWQQFAEREPFVRVWLDLEATNKNLQFFRQLQTDRIHPRYSTMVRTGRTSSDTKR